MKVSDKVFSEQAEGLTKSKSAGKKTGMHQSPAAADKTISDSDNMDSAKVKLSDRAQDMRKIKDTISSTPDVDEAKVAKYKSMLAKGDYKIDSKAIADKMIDEHVKSDFFSSAFKDE